MARAEAAGAEEGRGRAPLQEPCGGGGAEGEAGEAQEVAEEEGAPRIGREAQGEGQEGGDRGEPGGGGEEGAGEEAPERRSGAGGGDEGFEAGRARGKERHVRQFRLKASAPKVYGDSSMHTLCTRHARRIC